MGKRDPDVRVFHNTEQLSTALAEYVIENSDAAVKERGAFSIVLSGGNLIHLMRKLTKPPYVRMVDWSKWHVFWAEENILPKKHPDSFYRQAKEAFISKVAIKSENIFSVRLGVSAEKAMEEYKFSIRQVVRNRTVDVSPSSDNPRFDLILLVLGEDGHVASLFPEDPVLSEESQWVACVAREGKESVTFTLSVINSAANVAIMATGNDVAESVSLALGDPLPSGSNPAQMVSPRHGNLVWFVDGSAASLLPGNNSGESSAT
ncbi:probable 6-phosphogluconolactonase 1 [Macadamia integrifolia]|uniref:probable 6-phosphogluconolactonase 1 n=1 Tax=Macadamia integrifolia TaxID=60698 RepID=UPI001C4FD362|nr:probable 6-phosphogluconolactonase 1 [Macadamia integrifolia]XP_042499224.1 probable 6-phosphogluconolactonase 1 [Macadamia integrifolia]